jgi:N-acetylmuramoyl-L-alanine amidase
MMPLTDLYIEKAQSPNQDSRRGAAICMLVYHYTGASTIGGTVAWFLDPESKVSAHYVVGRTVLPGHENQTRVVQMVRHVDRAWHAGKSGWIISEDVYEATRGHGATWSLPRARPSGRQIIGVNCCSIGIEYVGKGKSFTSLQMRTGALLTARLMSDNSLLSRDNCVGHEHVSPGRKVDPGPNFDWDLHWRLVDQYQASAHRPAAVVEKAIAVDKIVVKEDHKMESGKDRQLDLAWKGFVARLKSIGVVG